MAKKKKASGTVPDLAPGEQRVFRARVFSDKKASKPEAAPPTAAEEEAVSQERVRKGNKPRKKGRRTNQ